MTGATGLQGPAGAGVVAGGTAGQVLSKIDGTDYNTQWVNGAPTDRLANEFGSVGISGSLTNPTRLEFRHEPYYFGSIGQTSVGDIFSGLTIQSNADSNVKIVAGSEYMVWTFGNNGNLTLPAGGTINNSDNTPYTGLQGIQGIQGIQGDPGLQGIQGDPGLQGIQGDPGAKGDTGLQGIQGDPGLQGIQGDPGAKGDTGLQGIQGDTGAAGPRGFTGPAGIGWKSVPTSPLGEAGDVDGDAAIGGGYLYYCTAAYDGVTGIWQRQALTGATW